MNIHMFGGSVRNTTDFCFPDGKFIFTDQIFISSTQHKNGCFVKSAIFLPNVFQWKLNRKYLSHKRRWLLQPMLGPHIINIEIRRVNCPLYLFITPKNIYPIRDKTLYETDIKSDKWNTTDWTVFQKLSRDNANM